MTFTEFSDVIPYILVISYQCAGGTYCPSLTYGLEVANSSIIMVIKYQTTQRL
jgi:hypothetical protein